jgi:hypothetical protein
MNYFWSSCPVACESHVSHVEALAVHDAAHDAFMLLPPHTSTQRSKYFHDQVSACEPSLSSRRGGQCTCSSERKVEGT